MEKLIKEVRLLKIYSLVLTCILLCFVLLSFRRESSKTKFQEIDVERINVGNKYFIALGDGDPYSPCHLWIELFREGFQGRK